jgi:hypothetical protein
MSLPNTLVARIDYDLGLFLTVYPGFLEQTEIVSFAVGERRANHLEALFVYDKLRL